MTASRFGGQLRAWRTAAGLTQARINTPMGKSSTFTAQLESGALHPPDRETCDAIERLLRECPGHPFAAIPEGMVWRAAAKERLERLHPDLADWHRAALVDDAGPGPHFTADEVALVEAARKYGGAAAVSRLLAAVVRLAPGARRP